MSDETQKFTYKFAYDESMTEVAIIVTSKDPIGPEMYLRAMASWVEYCRLNLHDLYKSRPSLETDKNLN